MSKGRSEAQRGTKKGGRSITRRFAPCLISPEILFHSPPPYPHFRQHPTPLVMDLRRRQETSKASAKGVGFGWICAVRECVRAKELSLNSAGRYTFTHIYTHLHHTHLHTFTYIYIHLHTFTHIYSHLNAHRKRAYEGTRNRTKGRRSCA